MLSGILIRLAVAGCTAVASFGLASSAMAHEFRSEVQPAFVVGEQLTQASFETGAGVMKCNVARFEGTKGGFPSSEITVFPEYSECSILGIVVSIKANGCAYVLGGGTDKNEHGQFRLECEAGKQMEIVVGGGGMIFCIAKFPSQVAAGGVHFVNAGSGSSRDFALAVTATALTYETSGKTCGFFGNGKDGAFTGSMTARGYADNGGVKGQQTGLWVE